MTTVAVSTVRIEVHLREGQRRVEVENDLPQEVVWFKEESRAQQEGEYEGTVGIVVGRRHQSQDQGFQSSRHQVLVPKHQLLHAEKEDICRHIT